MNTEPNLSAEAKMSNQELQELIVTRFPDAVAEQGKQFLSFTVDSTQWLPFAELLRSDSSLNFDYLFCLSGVDWLTHLMAVYHLSSTTHGHELEVKVKITDRNQPEVASVHHLWQTAEFHEREVFDLYGVVFTQHPDLRRILLDDDWVGYPLRKDYKDDINIVTLG